MIMFSVSSVSSSPGDAITITARDVVNLGLNAPGRCTVALRRQVTDPEEHCSVGGAFPGIVKDTGYVYIPPQSSTFQRDVR